MKEIWVAGPRYWQTRVGQNGSGSACLRDLYQSGVVFVQRKAGALSYADDPTGVRSLLSKAFHQVLLLHLHMLSYKRLEDPWDKQRSQAPCL